MLQTTPTGQARHTQAVVIIHGIGEQHPMATLRSFVESVLPEPDQGGEKYFSKPDRLSHSFELRKLQDRSQPRTHFFEYYWAYQVEGTTLKHVLAWIKTLLFRKPQSVPKRLLPVWVFSWIFLIVAVAGVLLGIGERVNQITLEFPPLVISSVSILSALAFTLIQGFVFYFVGDVARYLTPLPSNIKLRQTIRAEGIALLKRIHEEGLYERVILIGHSLGSMIAYDLLKYLWEEYKEVYNLPKQSNQEALAKLEEIGDCLQKEIGNVTVDDYMDAQVGLWKEMRSLGNPWLVTDLITMGSPLAHAAFVLASNESDLQARQQQRELPSNPPVPEVEEAGGVKRYCYSYRVWDKYGEKKDIPLRAVHHGGPFAFTRWTNLYFPSDLAGGPITVFGPGVRNIAVDSGKFLIDHSIGAHTVYWNKKAMTTQAKSNSVSEIVKALDLKNFGYFE